MARLLDRIRGHHDTLTPLMKAVQEERLAGTLLFSGPAGIGKKMAALALAQAIVCEKRAEGGCGECGSCVRIEKGQSESLLQIEPDGQQIKIEQARDAIQFIGLRTLGRGRAIVIDQAHALGPQAANALLKSLEEPPQATHFILITPLAAAVLPTIRSRSQLVRFKPLSETDLAEILREGGGKEVDPWVVASARGSVEVARSLLDSREEYAEIESATLRFLKTSLTGFPSEEVSVLRESLKDRGLHSFITGLIHATLRDAMRVHAGLKPRAIGEGAKISGEIAKKSARLEALSTHAVQLEQDLARNVDRGLIFENFALELRK